MTRERTSTSLSPSDRAAAQRAALADGIAVTDPNRDGDVILISNPNRRNGCATMMKIYNFARGARGQRVMWLCEEMGLPYAVQNLSFPVATDYRALNPLGTVPFLEDAGGVALNESVAIMLYIAQRYGPTPLLPTGNTALMAQCLQLTLFGETEVGMNLNPLVAAHFMAGEADKRNWSVIGLEQRVKRAIQYAETLIHNRSYLVGDDLTLADISVSCGFGIWQGALGGQLPEGLMAYQGRLRARPAYQRAKSRCADVG